ncbi:DEAD/DEAH box helicase [Larsenimonas rhizosphaerae]|uniref:DEAD/DEAH box helicase family protein n=1 Tax=Larsenimonas rhizosphaerae TaxID=2944682 RepID=A0AA42CWQ7_9GAMM|nr:DEAD/DEAH box helicase family protein [Larsenimonas rhizosphaerae]MCX2522908.1 DEAD/DEAH box helicase family protein [Larsenimonas rhizosphaerae]
MELKEYQQGVLGKLDRYLTVLAEQREEAEDFVEFQKSKGKATTLGDYCREAWDQLNTERLLPYLYQNGNPVVAPYLSRLDGLGGSIPNICLKVPTGGGKTLLATAALERVQTDYFKRQTGLVLWVVPSEAIYRQTWKQLANREHPYRQMLERASGGRVKLLEKSDAFTRRDVEGQLCVMLLMLPSAARKSKETLRLFRDGGRFTSFFPLEDDNEAIEALLQQVPNLDQNDLADLGYGDGIVPGSVSVKQSLGNVLRLVRPVVVIDEGHKAYSDTARDTLAGFNPRFILELSATPNTNGKHQSNVLVNVPGADLKDEEMIKLPINVINEGKGGWKHTLSLAHTKQQELEQAGLAFQNESGRYIRPIVLVRVERTGKEQRDAGFVHAEDAREYLRDQLGVKEEHIRLKTSSDDELADEDLLSPTSPVRFIITKDALREGWDCPFAYVLAVLSRTTATTALTQMIGRVLRQPHAQATGVEALDECYVFTFDQDVTEAVNGVRKGLEDEGMADLVSSVKAVDPGSGKSRNMRREIINRNDKFAGLPPIFLPRVLHQDSNTSDGYRALDYERDVLGELDWDALQFLAADKAAMDSDKLQRTVARVTLDRKAKDAGQSVFDLEQEEIEVLPEEGLDAPYLVRQLLDIVPNPWQGMRLLDETLDALRAKGVTNEQIYINRLDLVQSMKADLREQVNAMAESLFRAKLESGEIALRLMSSNDPALNWKIAETLEIDVSDVDPLLYRKNGEPLEKNLFEKVYQKEFNDLEKNTAWYLDEHQCVHWWHRIAVNQRSYGLQGWQKHKVYPDLLACVHGSEDGKFRFSVLETKGNHLKGNDDTEYKRKLFELLTRHADVSAEVGQLSLEGHDEPIRFKMVMEQDWKKTVSEALG